jgi:heme-degrading monooxygenase HmoA
MPVKVLITRRFKEGMALEVLKRLNQLRAIGINQPGYISGETLMGMDNPEKVLVISTWASEDQWKKWMVDPVRKSYEEEVEEFLSEPPEYEIFTYGL